MAKEMVHLVFPQRLIKKPIIYTVAKKFNIIPNIRRANVTETVGEVILELSGLKNNLDKAKRYLEKIGVKFEPITKDIVE
ncbi:MAG: NIL domain-containing protein [Candidatus Omnitrophica bacterium]|nr:NIL domain-containing protein [Candidatus Omnitrophota bacterium]MCM8826809.1 NIL domain-containing protein [Candidatus Omnitrophota bacterium]